MRDSTYDRTGARISFDRWQELTRQTGYSMVATNRIGSTLIRTRWRGQGEERVPPLIFETVVVDPHGGLTRTLSSTEEQALEVHNAAVLLAMEKETARADGMPEPLIKGML